MATTTVTYSSSTYQPADCGPSYSTCIRTTGTRTRVGPEPRSCGHCFATASVTINPRTINVKSNGSWVQASIQVADASLSDVDVSSLRLNGTVEGTHAVIEDGVLNVKFSRSDLIATFGSGSPQTITLTGSVGSDCFVATDTVRVKSSTLASPAAGASYAYGDVAAVSWSPDPGQTTVDVIASVDDGATWSVVARDVPNNGSYDWAVPGVNTTQARIGVVKILSIDQDGVIASDELGVSGAFGISSPLGVGTGALAFAMRGVTPNPAPGVFKVDFTLPTARPASIGVFDVAGRQIASREVGSLGTGVHSVEFGRKQTLKAGIYLVRLTQSGRTLTTHAVVAW